jgi:hypothetical protein
VLVPVLVLVLVIGARAASTGPLAAAQAGSGCEGQWLVQLTFEGRDAVEEAIAVFAADGGLVLYGPPVVPALPGGDDEPLHVSDAVGGWAPGSGVHCTFDAVRLLVAADGVALGAVYLQGGIVVDESGLGLTGTFTYDQSSGLGRTVSSGSGTLVGTSISS